MSASPPSEKRFHLYRVPGDLKPRHVGIEGAGSEDEAISIDWPDGHRTRYRSSEIRGFLSLPRLEPRYWDGRRHLQDACFEHDNVRNHLRWLRFGGRI